MPDTGFGRAGVLVGWAKQPGDRVEASEPTGTVEVDVAEFELFPPSSGTLVKLLVAPGETVTVGRPLAELEARRDRRLSGLRLSRERGRLARQFRAQRTQA